MTNGQGKRNAPLGSRSHQVQNMNVTAEQHQGRKRKCRGLREKVSKAGCTAERRETGRGNSGAEEKAVREAGQHVTGRAKYSAKNYTYT